MHSMLEAAVGAAQSAADLLFHQPLAWLWRCCVRRPHVGMHSGPPLWLRPPSRGLGRFDPTVFAATRAGEFVFPLITMTLYGATHYMRWAHLARAVGVRMNGRAKALVAASYLLVPNLLCPFLDVRCLHIVLVCIVTANNLFLYREFCIMEQLHVFGQRLPGEPMLVGMFQAAHVLHEAFEEPGRMLWRKVRRHVPALLSPGGLAKLHVA